MQTLQPRVLVIDGDRLARALMVDSLARQGFQVAEAETGVDALERLAGFAYDGVVVDLDLPDMDGEAVLDEAVARYPGMCAVVTTDEASVSKAVAAVRRGASHFLVKPVEPSEVAAALREGCKPAETSGEENEPGGSRGFLRPRVIGESDAMQHVLGILQKVSPMGATVLIEGDTGTGKEVIARTIHENSRRRHQRFVAFNAGAIPEGLAEAELFGHARGAFTGAVSNRVGRFELAHQGTIFIDEVGSMPLPLQVKLLRALQEHEIERVGESRPIKFDARVIAATNVDLGRLVKEGRFREDLYYRLNVVRVKLPALRERATDIPLLARHFVEKSCRQNMVPQKTLGQDACRALMSHSWPGNIRQLENAIEHAVVMSGALRQIGVDALPVEVTRPAGELPLPAVTIPDSGLNFTSVVSQLERELLLRCLEKTGGNKRQAARLLHLSRTTLIDKLNRLNVQMEEEPAA